MKAILYFRLPDDQAAFDIASQSVELATALSKFRDWMEAMKTESNLCRKSLQTIEHEFKGLLDDFDIVLADPEPRIIKTPPTQPSQPTPPTESSESTEDISEPTRTIVNF